MPAPGRLTGLQSRDQRGHDPAISGAIVHPKAGPSARSRRIRAETVHWDARDRGREHNRFPLKPVSRRSNLRMRKVRLLNRASSVS
jgi:hypothetical protein